MLGPARAPMCEYALSTKRLRTFSNDVRPLIAPKFAKNYPKSQINSQQGGVLEGPARGGEVQL
jgi:hypothetical protein